MYLLECALFMLGTLIIGCTSQSDILCYISLEQYIDISYIMVQSYCTVIHYVLANSPRELLIQFLHLVAQR